MATITTDLICNLNQPVAATFLHGNLFSQDNAGNTINVHVMDNGEPATIGGTVSANVIRADGNTVAVSGAIDGNKAYVILPQACYAVPGRVEIIIKLTQSTTITTIAAIVANVYRSTTDTVVDPGTIIPSIQTLIAEIEEAVDSIPVDYSGLLATIAADYSSSKTYQVGQYAWQGGVLKRCIVPITTAETYTAAHWTNAVIGDDLSALKSAINDTDTALEKTETVGINLLNVSAMTPGKVISSDGTLSDNVNRWTTDFIPLTSADGGVVITDVSGASATVRRSRSARAVAQYNSNKEFISGTYAYGNDGYSIITANANAAYIRLSFVNTDFENNADATYKMQIEYGTSTTGILSLSHYQPYQLTITYGKVELLDNLKTDFDNQFATYNLADSTQFVSGYTKGVNSAGTSIVTGANADYFYTGNIPVSPGDVISHTKSRLWTVIGEDGSIKSYANNSEGQYGSITIPSNGAFIIFTGYIEDIERFMVNKGSQLLAYSVYGQLYLENAALPLQTAKTNALLGGDGVRISESSLSSGTKLYTDEFPLYLKCGYGISAKAKFSSFTSITFGKGYEGYRGDAIKIDGTNVYWIHYNDSGAAVTSGTEAHGLTIGTFISTSIYVDNDSVCNVRVITLSGAFDCTFNWNYQALGQVFLIGEQAMTDVVVSANTEKIKCPVWIIGDSYLSFTSDRVSGQLKTMGFANAHLITGLPGGNSDQMEYELLRLLRLGGMPKVLIWALGMNGSESQNTSKFPVLARYVQSYGVIVILYKVPIVPTRKTINAAINTAVDATGYRFIDANAAVGANSDGEWYSGYLSNDGVHPTELGAKAIAMQYLLDVPEIMTNGYSD